MIRGRVFLSLCVLLFCAFLAGRAAERVVATDGEAKVVEDLELQWEYVPNQLLVKFRSRQGASPLGEAAGHSEVAEHLEATERLEETGRTEASLDGDEVGAVVTKSLDRLNQRFRVLKSEKVFLGFAKHRRKMEGLRKKAPGKLTKLEKRLLQRGKRAPVGPEVPALDRIYLLELEEGQDLAAALAACRQDPGVEYAELNYLQYGHKTPNDSYFSIQWPLNNTGQMYPESGKYNAQPGTPDCDIDAPEAWDVNTGSSEVIVAVVDSGVDYTHTDLDDNMWTDSNGFYGYDFINDDNDPMDDFGHGTHCAGIIAAEGNNGLGITGVCWNTKIMALKFLGIDGYGSGADAISAFYYAVENGADVISNSWGGGGYMESMEEAINYAYSQGVIMVAAAGNDNSTDPHYPAYYDHVISVAATNSNDEKASFSAYGDWVDIAAPGVDVLSLRATGTFMGTTYLCYTTIMSGTSMSCPHVAGACALMLSIYSGIDVNEVEQVLLQSTDPISPEICISGRLNLYQATQLLAGTSRGAIFLDNDVYNCCDLIGIRLLDADLKGNGTHQVTVESDEGDSETVSLTETSPFLGVFTGSIASGSGDPNTEDGIVQLSHDEIITATYYDANDGTGSPAIATDTAMADCQGAVIFNVQVEVPGPEPTVTFETNEPTVTRVLCGQDCGVPNDIIATDSVLSITHTIQLAGVLPETDYYFVIEATDAVGNEIVDDNDGACFAFTTDAGPRDVFVPSQYGTIQKAIDISWDGGTVWVADGTYTGEGNHNIDFKGKAIIVKSENGPESCLIDCNGTETGPHRGFNFHLDEDSNSVLDGFTIKNGYGPTEQIVNSTRSVGGAILCSNSSPVIQNCIIAENGAALGGGIFCYRDSKPAIRNCLIVDNTASYGGGMYYRGSSPAITNCTISGNSADTKGGGIRCYDGSNPIIDNCILWDNQADSGEGHELALRSDCNVSVAYSDVAGGQWAVDLEGAVDLEQDLKVSWGAGNIDVAPCFVDPNNADYHLRPGSLCVDAGTNSPSGGLPAEDIEGQSRPIDGDNDGNAVADMGAYESLACDEPLIDLSAERFKFEARQGGANPDAQILSVRNSGGETLNWAVNYECGWLVVDPCEGSSTGELDEITLSVDITALGSGNYNCQLTISDSNAVNSPKTVEAKLRLYGDGQLPVPLEYPTIQAAIDAAADGNVVIVADGIYTGVGNRDIDFKGKAIAVRSENGPENCIIDCQNQGRGFHFHSGEDANSVVDGFTITNGYAGYGGGIRCTGSSPTIINCIISGNSTRSDYPPVPERWSGGGLYGCNGPIINCTISRNWSFYEGGGLFECSGPISNCIIRGNSGSKGGGLYECDGPISNCTISGNRAFFYIFGSYGDGGGLSECDGTISNCTISGNSAENGGGLRRCDGEISNCTISGNLARNKGGGLFRCWGSISNCAISGNSALVGGGLSLCGTTSNCNISGNSAGEAGGGVDSAVGAVRNCTITGNKAAYGGAIADDQGLPVFSNCTISGNRATCDGGAIYCWVDSDPTVANSILWGNTATRGNEIAVALFNDPWGGTIPSSITVRYSDVEGEAESVHVDPECTLNWGSGNIDIDPHCIQLGYWDPNGTPEDTKYSWVEGDYHLRWDSLCIDTGDPGYAPQPSDKDIDGEPRVMRDNRVDMGSDEVGLKQADFTRNGIIDGLDLSVLLNSWLAVEEDANWYVLCDLFNNKQIDMMDYARFAADWLWQADWYED